MLVLLPPSPTIHISTFKPSTPNPNPMTYSASTCLARSFHSLLLTIRPKEHERRGTTIFSVFGRLFINVLWHQLPQYPLHSSISFTYNDIINILYKIYIEYCRLCIFRITTIQNERIKKNLFSRSTSFAANRTKF